MRLFLWILTVLIASICFAPASKATSEPFNIAWTKVLSEPAIGIDWSPDGRSIVFSDAHSEEIALLNWQTDEIIWRTPLPESDRIIGAWAFSARWSPNGRWIAATNTGMLYLIDPQTGDYKPLEVRDPSERDQPFYVVARWGSDSASLAALDQQGFVDILAAETGAIIQTLDLRGETYYADVYYTTFDWSPDGEFFASVYWNPPMINPTVGFWDRKGNLQKEYTREDVNDPNPSIACLGNTERLTYIEWAQDNRTLLAADAYGYGTCSLNSDGTIDFHYVDTNGSSIFRWSPDQRWIAAATTGWTTIWITDTANNYRTTVLHLPEGSSMMTSFAWSPDSQHLAVGTIHELWIGTLEAPDDSP